MKVASAPVSWGITEVEGLRSDYPYARVMDEIRAAGYEGTELGPWGFYPTSPDALAAQLQARGLSLVGAFVDVPVHDPALFDKGRQAVRQAVSLLTQACATMLILSAQGTPERARIAGRVSEADGLAAAQWKEAGAYLEELARIAHEAGLDTTFHHHAGTYVETPAEIDRLFAVVDPDVLGLCLDTGHLVYGGGDNMRIIPAYGQIIRHVHLKNVNAQVLQKVRAEGLDYVQTIRSGLFSPLESGSVDIVKVLEALKRIGYDGWFVIEQDIDLLQPGHQDPLQGATRAREYLRASCLLRVASCYFLVGRYD